MIKKETVLFHAGDRDDKMFLSSVYDCMKRASEKGIPSFTGFMSERKQALCEKAFKTETSVEKRFWGGYDKAERKMLCFYSDDTGEFPIGIIRVSSPSRAELSHRDYLGALMALGIERDTVGDILVLEGEGYIFAKKEICDYITLNFKEIGRYNISCETAEDIPETGEAKLEKKDITVASMRLDCILAAALDLSREKAKLYIEGGKVCIDGKPCLRQDAAVDGNTVISARGFGRIAIEEIKGKSKKGRTILKVIRMR